MESVGRLRPGLRASQSAIAVTGIGFSCGVQIKRRADCFGRRPGSRRAPYVITHQEIANRGERRRARLLQKAIEPLQILSGEVELGVRSEVNPGQDLIADRAVIPGTED